MRNALMFSLLLIFAVDLAAQTPAAPAGRGAQPAPTAKPQAPATGQPAPTTTAKPQTTPPAQPARGRQPAAPAATGRAGMAITATDPRGVPLPNVSVEASGPTPRTGTTNESGQLSLLTMTAGTYRMTFSGEHVTALEREVTLKASAVLQVEVMLKPAPPPREIIKEVAAPVTEAPKAAVGPSGQTQVTSLVDMAERQLDRKQERRESLVSCSGNTRSTLLQINADQPDRLYEDAESLFYVIAGEGFLRVDSKETRLVAGGFASVPRKTAYALGRRGRNPLILLSVLSGEPCETAK